jgi:lysozyme family protein
MSSKFQNALDFTFRHEGGLSNHKNDKGGLTNYGITFKVFKMVHPDANEDDLKSMTTSAAAEIYEKFYWDAHSLDKLPEPLSIIVFDQVVNRGFSAIRSLQRAYNLTIHNKHLSVDGIMGPASVAALVEISKEAKLELTLNFIDECRNSYIDIVKRDTTQLDFLKGWLKRLANYYTLFL